MKQFNPEVRLRLIQDSSLNSEQFNPDANGQDSSRSSEQFNTKVIQFVNCINTLFYSKAHFNTLTFNVYHLPFTI
jgi:hypothetical protein